MRANKASRTALGVSRALVYLSHDPELGHLLPARSAEYTRRMTSALSRKLRYEAAWMEQGWYRRLMKLRERMFSGADILHIGLRKRFFDEQARDALEAGATQLVLLGAGFDTLGARLSEEFPEASFFEIDHPATQRAKRRALAALPGERPNLHLLAVDFGQTNLRSELLAHEAYDRSAQTLVSAEGLLMYLTVEAVTELFEFVSNSCGPGSRIVFSFIGTDAEGRPHIGRKDRLIRILLKLFGEPFQWGIQDGDLPAFLKPLGLELRTIQSDVDLVARLAPDCRFRTHQLMGWERVAWAIREQD